MHKFARCSQWNILAAKYRDSMCPCIYFFLWKSGEGKGMGTLFSHSSSALLKAWKSVAADPIYPGGGLRQFHGEKMIGVG